MTWLFVGGALVVTIGWLGYRRRMTEIRGHRLTDEDLRAIESHGRISADAPLDLEEAAEEEERFWEESWDEPEPM